MARHVEYDWRKAAKAYVVKKYDGYDILRQEVKKPVKKQHQCNAALPNDKRCLRRKTFLMHYYGDPVIFSMHEEGYTLMEGMPSVVKVYLCEEHGGRAT
jgi:hypothetical protein